MLSGMRDITRIHNDSQAEFVMSETGWEAVLSTLHTMNIGMSELSHRLDAANEAIIILNHRLDDVDVATRQPIPAWR